MMRGAVLGAGLGILLNVAVIFLPIWLQGSGYYEIGDTLIVLGAPLLFIPIVVGAARGRRRGRTGP